MLKMAGSFGKIFRKFTPNSTGNMSLTKLINLQNFVPSITIERSLYSKNSLGLDLFEQQRERTKSQLSNLENKFKVRMKEYIGEDKNMIFTEDLKNMIHLAENDEDTELVINMITRFNQQNKQLRFGSFKFGPVVMRLFHLLNKPELAIQCFKNEEFSGFFDQLVTYQIYLDLLYENKMYKEVLVSFDLIQSKQIEGAMFPRNSIVVVLAACYKLNNAESVEYAFNLWKKLETHGYFPNRRAVTFCAALALNQGNAQAALEIISNAKNQGYTTVRNIKALALTQLGRLEDVLPILKGVLEMDMAGEEKHTFNRDVLEKIRERILNADNPELSVQFNRIDQLFQKEGHISEKTLDEQLCSQIQTPPKRPVQQEQRYTYRDNYRQRASFSGNRNSKFTSHRQRPGLADLV